MPGYCHSCAPAPAIGCSRHCDWQLRPVASSTTLAISELKASHLLLYTTTLVAQLTSLQHNSCCFSLCRVALLLLTTHTLPPDAWGVVTSMVLQALLRPHSSSSSDSSAQLVCLLDCAIIAFLLNLLHYLLLQASQTPAPALIHHVDALLKVSLCYAEYGTYKK